MIKMNLYFEILNQLLLISSSMAKQWRYLKNALVLLSEFLSIKKNINSISQLSKYKVFNFEGK